MTNSIRKQEAALQGLLESGWIKPDMLDAICSAARQACDPEHMLEFAIRIGTIQREYPHVLDALDMAIKADRRIDLRWSARRWREEHERLRRLFTTRELARKAASDVPFDTAWLERALPPRPATGFRQFSLLDTPRRLALESHRQAHCIVSYAERFRSGALGGVSVLTGDGQRWTVTVKPPTDRSRPSINQIYGRRNRMPNRTTRRRILDILGPGIADVPHEPHGVCAARPSSSTSNSVPCIRGPSFLLL